MEEKSAKEIGAEKKGAKFNTLNKENFMSTKSRSHKKSGSAQLFLSNNFRFCTAISPTVNMLKSKAPII